jgi:hypothetical protein
MANRGASIYLTNKGTLIVLSEVKTTVGLGMAAPPIIVLQTQDPLALGHAVLEALAASGRVVPHPTDWREHDRQSKLEFAPLFEAAKVKTWSGVQRHCALIDISESAGKLSLTIWERASGQSYVPSDAGSRELLDPSPAAIGTEIMQAFVESNLRENAEERFP